MKILIVDNDEQILASMSKLLGRMGHKVVALSDSHHAHEDILFADPPFDAVILDQDLGVKRPTGPEIAQGLMRGRCRDIPIAFASGMDMGDLRLEFPTAFFMPKPYGKSDLEEFIEHVRRKNKPPLS